jgi:hypothetical protein
MLKKNLSSLATLSTREFATKEDEGEYEAEEIDDNFSTLTCSDINTLPRFKVASGICVPDVPLRLTEYVSNPFAEQYGIQCSVQHHPA